jgi:hypothetical protein
MCPYEVIIPVRNGGEPLANSIESVFSSKNPKQVFLTISDNFSTDAAPWKRVLQSFPAEQWRVISPPEPLGRVEHWTWAFGEARSPWVKLLMAGDRIDGAFWEWADAGISRFSGVGMLFCGAFVIDPNSAHPKAGGSSSLDQWTYDRYERDDFVRDAVQALNRIGALSQVLLRAEVLRAALPFQPEFPWTADWRFYGRCLERTSAIQNQAGLVSLNRGIARLSTSWKGIRTSFTEDWNFAAEQAAAARTSGMASFWKRSTAIAGRAGFAIGRRLLPRSLRRFLTTASGLHREKA